MKSLPFVKDRALASRNAQASVAAQWVWPEKNVAEWDSALTELETLGAVERTASVDLQAHAANWDVTLKKCRAHRAGCFAPGPDPVSSRPGQERPVQSHADAGQQP